MVPVVAKFKLSGISTREYGNNPDGTLKILRTLEFFPVYPKSDEPNHENRKFWEATPSGKIELGSTNDKATNQFEIGKEYYITFTEKPLGVIAE